MKSKAFYTKLLAASLLAGTVVASNAAVEEANFDLKSTNDLYLICAATDEDPNFMAATYMCRGFMEGAHQYHDAVVGSEKMERLACAPEGTTLGEARLVFISWSRQNSGDAQLMGEAPVVGFVRSLKARFPCVE